MKRSMESCPSDIDIVAAYHLPRVLADDEIPWPSRSIPEDL